MPRQTLFLLYVFIFCLLTPTFSGCQQTQQSEPSPDKLAEIYRPMEDFGSLFHDVQTQPVFADSKTFVDSTPTVTPRNILAQYRAQKIKPDFNLNAFVHTHFNIPEHSTVTFTTDADKTMREHLMSHWSYLTRPADKPRPHSSLLPLPYPYIIPGGRFREIYYWDSYFTMVGLGASDRWDLVEDMLNNFAYLLKTYNRIPNGNRSYYLSRSQPPFFAAMVSLWRAHKGDKAALSYLPALMKEYQFWMQGQDQLTDGKPHSRVVKLSDGRILNRYYDDLAKPRPESYREDIATADNHPQKQRDQIYRDLRAAAESGWDFSSRWFANQNDLTTIETTNIIPVDLNSLLFHLESLIAELQHAAGEQNLAKIYSQKARDRQQAIRKWLWNETQHWYGDFHFINGRSTEVASLAMVYPLFFNIATDKQASQIATLLEDVFLKPGGLVTTLNHTGEQWDAPNGWAPLQWLAIKGLQNYGKNALAQKIAQRWIDLNRRVYQDTGKMMEKYNVENTLLEAGGGEYPLQDGFGWTNGVAIAILKEGIAQ